MEEHGAFWAYDMSTVVSMFLYMGHGSLHVNQPTDCALIIPRTGRSWAHGIKAQRVVGRGAPYMHNN